MLCRPRGGLNDMLNQIHVCWRYARRSRRTLVLDTRWSGLLEPFDRYFELRRDSRRILLTPTANDAFVRALRAARPTLIDQSSPSPLDASGDTYRDAATGESLTSDLSSDHPDDVLVHERHGGGASGPDVLRRLRLTREVASEITRRLTALPRPYTAIHVRNTDLTSDYRAFIAEQAPQLSGRTIAIATDDGRVLDHAEEAIADARIVRLTTTPRSDGRQLHANPDVDRWEANVDALFDLIMLASADRLLICPLDAAGPKRSRMSGFSRLALQLHERPALVRALLSNGDRMARAA